MKSFISAAVVAAASFAFVAVAQAQDIPATPLNHGPIMVGGLPVPPVNVVAPFNAVLGGKPAMDAEPAMAPHHRHHRMHKKMAMKKM